MEGDKDRQRVLKACTGCKSTRRKCDGMYPCEYCTKRGIPCEYDAVEPRKRGPKRGSKQQKLVEENLRLREELARLKGGAPAPGRASTSSTAGGSELLDSPAESRLSVEDRASKTARDAAPAAKRRAKAVEHVEPEDTLNAAAAILTLSHLPDPKTLLESTVWQPPGPIVPTAEEEALLRTFFEYANRLVPVVNEPYFYSALEEAQYYPAPDSKKDGASPLFPMSLHTKLHDNPLTTVLRNSEIFGFRVCYYTLLCVGAKVQGRYSLAKRYYELARAYIGPCFSQPSQHLVSALLLMTMITRSMCSDVQQAALHAALAMKMAEMVPVTPEIRMVARIFTYAHSPDQSAAWPELDCPSGMPAHQRMADLLGFSIHQLMTDFVGVTSVQDQASLERLLQEALCIQTEHSVLKMFPLQAFSLGISALLHSKAKHLFLALDLARQCIELALADKLSRFCFPCIFVIAKLMPLLQTIQQTAEFGQFAADQTKKLSASACTFLKESRQTIEGCPNLAEVSRAHCGDSEADGAPAESGADTTECGPELRGATCDPCGFGSKDAMDMIGSVVLRGVCPKTGNKYERRVPAEEALSSRKEYEEIVEPKPVRPVAAYDARRKLPSGLSDSLRQKIRSPAEDVPFSPTAMMRMSAAMAPKASKFHPATSELESRLSNVVIPSLLDDSASATHSPVFGGMFQDQHSYFPKAPGGAYRVASFGSIGMPFNSSPAIPSSRQASPLPSTLTPSTHSKLDAATTGFARDFGTDLESLAQQAFGDSIMDEFDREERQAGLFPTVPPSPAVSEDDDAGSVTSLGLHLRSTVGGLLGGLQTDLLETF